MPHMSGAGHLQKLRKDLLKLELQAVVGHSTRTSILGLLEEQQVFQELCCLSSPQASLEKTNKQKTYVFIFNGHTAILLSWFWYEMFSTGS